MKRVYRLLILCLSTGLLASCGNTDNPSLDSNVRPQFAISQERQPQSQSNGQRAPIGAPHVITKPTCNEPIDCCQYGPPKEGYGYHCYERFGNRKGQQTCQQIPLGNLINQALMGGETCD